MSKLLQTISWENWDHVNLDQFREDFPQFRQSEMTALNQIVSGQYKASTLAPDAASHHQEVFAKFKKDPELVAKAEQWLKSFEIKTATKKNAILTPTVIAPKK